jgi:ADP-heptose:LPS heptosyltransferase
VKILLVRLDGIGDAVACTPLIAALRESGHRLGLALSDRNAGIFTARTAAATHVLERIPWPQHGSTPASRTAAEAGIAAERYDVALIASEEPEAYGLAAGIPRRIGFVTGWAKPFKTLWARARLTTVLERSASSERERGHEVEVLFRLGATFTTADPPREPERLRPWIADGPQPQRAGIVVQLSTKWSASGIDDETLRTIAASLRERGASYVVAPAERDAVARSLPEVPLVVPRNVREWVAAIDAAAALVSVDTGAAHLAGMLGVPVVDVFPDAGFEHQTRRWRPWASSSIVLRASELCRAPASLIGSALDAL